MTPETRVLAAGDRAFVVELGDAIDPLLNARVQALAQLVTERLAGSFEELVPTYRSLLVIHDPLQSDRDALVRQVTALADELQHHAPADPEGRLVHLPACYGGPFGPDLEDVAQHAGLSPDEVVALHAGATYLVYMLGFTPGFPYLGGMPAAIATPRLETPRQKVAAGFIGIGGQQTGIYPVESPGGWRLIARTPVPLFDPGASAPFLLRAGDRLRFEPVGPDDFATIAAEVAAGRYVPSIEAGREVPASPARGRS